MTMPRTNKKKMNTHLIEDISYSLNYILCKCGWKDTIESFQGHRLSFSEKEIKRRERERERNQVKKELVADWTGLDE